jgi:hypothetical protein
MTDLETMCESIAEDMRECNAYAEAFSDDILDIRVNGYYGHAGIFTIDNVSILVSFGGPNIWVDIEESGQMTVRGYWASDKVEWRGVASSSLTVWCNEYAYSILQDVTVAQL